MGDHCVWLSVIVEEGAPSLVACLEVTHSLYADSGMDWPPAINISIMGPRINPQLTHSPLRSSGRIIPPLCNTQTVAIVTEATKARR